MSAATTPRIKVYLLAPRKRPHYQLQWSIPGTADPVRRVTETTGTADPARAEQMRADRECDLNAGRYPVEGRRKARATAPPAAAPVTWADIRARYEAERLPALAADSRRAARRALDLWAGITGARLASDITPAACRRFLAGLASMPLAQSTRALYAARARAALRWAADPEGGAMLAAAPRLAVPCVPRRAIRTVTPEQFKALLAACPSPCWRLYLHALWHTGLRQSEAAALRWADGAEDGARVDLAAGDGGRVILPAEAQKGGEEDSWLPIHPDLRRELLRVPKAGRAGPLFPGVGTRMSGRADVFRGIAARAGVRGRTLHSLRRTFGTRYAPHVQPQTLMRLMRHSDIKTTLRYYADMAPGLEAAIRAV